MAKTVRFDNFEVDLAAGQIYRRGMKVGLREKSFQVLAYLLEQPGEVGTREQLQQRLWPADVFVDFENNLNTAVARLREALGDSAEHPRFIETLPKRGYRFVASVSAAPCVAERPSVPTAGIVVLPFLNLSGDRAQEYFADAMTDDIITELGALAPDVLSVIARTTAMRYKDKRKDIAQIARELGVDYVVEGGVRRIEDRIALNIQLIRVSNRAQVFANRYHSDLNKMFSLQNSVAREIAEHIDVAAVAEVIKKTRTLAAPDRKNPTRNLAAYDEYLQGKFIMGRTTPETFSKARQHFAEAISRDPEFALAHDALAEIYLYLGYFGFMSPTDAFSTGVLYAMRALEIDNTLGETHALLGQYHKLLNCNWPEVDKEMARALALSPASPIVRVRYAFDCLMPQGRLEEAVAELERAAEWDPLSPFVRGHLGAALLLWRRYDRAIEQCRRLLELDQHSYWAYLFMGSCYRDQRMFKDAIAAHRRATELAGGATITLGWLGLTLGLAGECREARALLERLQEMTTQAYVPPTSVAWIHLGLGEIDDAFEWLDRAIDARDQLLMPIKSYWFFDPIRADPRFHALLRKMHLDVDQ